MGPSDTHTPVMGQTTSTDSVQIKNLLLLVTWNCSYFAAYGTLRSAEPKKRATHSCSKTITSISRHVLPHPTAVPLHYELV